MIGWRQQPTRRRLRSRFAVPSGMPGGRRHGRGPGVPGHEPLRLVRPFRGRAAASTTRISVAAWSRISLVLAPRIELGSVERALPSGAAASSAPAIRPTAILSTRVERLVRQVERHGTRVERSERVILAPGGHPTPGGTTPGPPDAHVVEPAPRLVPVRAPEAAPAATAGPPRASTATGLGDVASTWRPPDASALAEGVLRELDRRIVAERERRGSLG